MFICSLIMIIADVISRNPVARRPEHNYLLLFISFYFFVIISPTASFIITDVACSCTPSRPSSCSSTRSRWCRTARRWPNSIGTRRTRTDSSTSSTRRIRHLDVNKTVDNMYFFEIFCTTDKVFEEFPSSPLV